MFHASICSCVVDDEEDDDDDNDWRATKSVSIDSGRSSFRSWLFGWLVSK